MLGQIALQKRAIQDMGEARLKIVAMPSDTNAAGNIFGGFIMSQIDLAGSVVARELAPVRLACMDKIIFRQPVFVNDLLCFYAQILQINETMIKIQVELVSERINEKGFAECVIVASALLSYLRLD